MLLVVLISYDKTKANRFKSAFTLHSDKSHSRTHLMIFWSIWETEMQKNNSDKIQTTDSMHYVVLIKKKQEKQGSSFLYWSYVALSLKR